MLRLQIYGNVFERRAKLEVSFAVPQPELRDAGLPGAKRRDADNRGVFFCLLCLHEQEKKVACRGETRPLAQLALAFSLKELK